jgi:hypothetical protein
MTYTAEHNGQKVEAQILSLTAHYPSPATVKLKLKNGEIIIKSIKEIE